MGGLNKGMAVLGLTLLTGFAAAIVLSGGVTYPVHPGFNLLTDVRGAGTYADGGFGKMATINVADASAFASALSSAKGGDVIVLAPGNYGNVKISSRTYDSAVTIMSANSTDMAHFERLTLDKSSNLVFKQVDIGGAPQAGENSTFVANITGSSKVTFDRVHVHGTLDGDPTTDRSGISVRGSNSIKLINSEFEQLVRGAWLQRSSDVEVVGNNFHDIRLDGIANAAVTNVVIDGNKFTDFYRQPEDHSDAIQFWQTNETVASTDIIIRNNQILQGKGTAMQGIFMRDESNKLPYERVLIENNLVYESGYANGITVMGGRDITMRGNTAISSPVGVGVTKIRLENITGAVISKNVTDMFAEFGTNKGIAFDGNVTIPSEPNFFKTLTDIAAGAAATVQGLVTEGVGYQLPAGSQDKAATPTAVAPTPITTTVVTQATAAAATTSVVVPVTAPEPVSVTSVAPEPVPVVTPLTAPEPATVAVTATVAEQAPLTPPEPATVPVAATVAAPAPLTPPEPATVPVTVTVEAPAPLAPPEPATVPVVATVAAPAPLAPLPPATVPVITTVAAPVPGTVVPVPVAGRRGLLARATGVSRSRYTASSVSAEPVPTAFTAPGLYTAPFSSSGFNSPAPVVPLPAAAASPNLGRGLLARALMFHA